MPQTSIKTPCIGVCSTGIGGNICRGCKRYMHEIVNWNGYSDDERQVIMDRLEKFLDQIVRAKFEILDQQKFVGFLTSQNITLGNYSSLYCWIYQLLKAGANQINSFSDFGLALAPEHQGKSAIALRDEIDSDFYILSCAHYERYFELKN